MKNSNYASLLKTFLSAVDECLSTSVFLLLTVFDALASFCLIKCFTSEGVLPGKNLVTVSEKEESMQQIS